MFSFRRIALLLALGLAAMHVIQAQSTSSSSTPASPSQDSAQQPAAPQPQQMSVQARIRARREQRRQAAIREVYSHLYEAYVGGGYLRFPPGKTLQRVTMYSWDAGLTRYFDERLGVTLDGRGYYGTPYVGLNFSGITKPAISVYSAMLGPTYRFYMQPRYSVAGRVMGGFVEGNFTGDTSGFGSICPTPGSCLLYPDSSTFGVSASVIGEYNMTPNVGIRLAPEYFASGFSSSFQSSVGFTGAIVYRFGKQ